MNTSNIAIAAALIGALLYTNYSNDLVEHMSEWEKGVTVREDSQNHQFANLTASKVAGSGSGSGSVPVSCGTHQTAFPRGNSSTNGCSKPDQQAPKLAGDLAKIALYAQQVTTSSLNGGDNQFGHHLTGGTPGSRAEDQDHLSQILKGDSGCSNHSGVVIRQPLNAT